MPVFCVLGQGQNFGHSVSFNHSTTLAWIHASFSLDRPPVNTTIANRFSVCFWNDVPGCGPALSDPRSQHATVHADTEVALPEQPIEVSASPTISKDRESAQLELLSATENLPLQFVGSLKCQECHRDQFDNYAQTDHAHSLRIPGPDDKQECDVWIHEPSQLALQAKVKDGILHHLGWQMIGPNHEFPLPSQMFRSNM